MIRSKLTSAAILLTLLCGVLSAACAPSVFESSAQLIAESPIDQFIFAKLSEQGIHPVLCSDAVFIRRVYLDLLGKLPPAEEAAKFIQDTETKKRGRLINELLTRHEYADYWSMRWGDTLRIKAEFPINLWPNAAQAYHHWVHTAIAENKPYDQFARALLTSSGSNFRVGPVNFYRAIQNKTPEGIATVVALTFMGVRTGHWSDQQRHDLSKFFSQVGYKPTNEWKEENVFWDPLKTSATKGNSAPGVVAITTTPPAHTAIQSYTKPESVRTIFPDGKRVQLSENRDPREIFADWLIRPENPWFTRCAVNRTWAWLLGRGIVHEPDDLRTDNPPSHPELLSWLEQELIDNHYDMKHLIRTILNSQTYQLSSVSPTDALDAARYFATYPIRRLEAEVLIDAINDVTGTSDLYTSAIPEPFTYIPQDMPAVAIADGSIISPFLVLFGRSARATGLSTERNNQTSAAQWRHLLNSSHIQNKIEKGPNMRRILSKTRPPRETLDELYLSLLSRYPNAAEVDTAMAYGNFKNPPPALRPLPQAQLKKMKPKARRAALKKRKQAQLEIARAKKAKLQKGRIPVDREKWNDIAWSLINSPEFLYRH